MSLKIKLITFCVAIGLIPLIIVGTVSVESASRALSTQAFGQLEAVRDSKKKNIEDLVAKWFHEVKLFSNVKEIYNTVGLISEYTLENEIPGKRLNVESGEYKELHRYATTPFKPFVKILGYDDAILINDYGRVIYTYKKDKDLGADLLKGKYKNSNLARVFHKAVKGKVAFADFEPYAPLDGSPAAFVAAPVHSHAGDIQGVVALRIPLDEINSIMTLRSGMGETGESYLVGADFFMRSDSELYPHFRTVKTSFLSPEKGKVDSQAVKSAIDGNSNTAIIKGRDGTEKLTAYAPIQIGDSRWALISEIKKDEAFYTVRQLRLTTLILSFVTALIVVVISLFFLKKTIIDPLKRIEDFVSSIAKGNFKADLKGIFKSEIKNLADGILIMVGELKNKLGFSQGMLEGMTVPCLISDTDAKISYINAPLCQLLESGISCENWIGRPVKELLQAPAGQKGIISTCLENKSPVMNVERRWPTKKGRFRDVRIDAAPLYDLDKQLIGGFAVIVDLSDIKSKEKQIREQNMVMVEITEKAKTISKYLTKGASEIEKQVDHVSSNTDKQFDRIEYSSQAITEMNQTLLNSAENAENAATQAHNTQSRAKDGMQTMTETSVAINQLQSLSDIVKENMHILGDQSESIGGVIGVINDIADQTNLLALNAAIEAARAGEAGRGFAVVADEVRKLAEKTVHSTKEIEVAIKNIQSSARSNIENTDMTVEAVSHASGLVDKSVKVFHEISDMSVNTATEIQRIAQATDKQSDAHSQIHKSIEDLKMLAGNTKTDMRSSAKSITSLARTAQELEKLIERLSSAGSI
ncbi:methyl-accepting chemotaxis protein [Maridesulfovibrio hydrothermalis]|uniref:Methyl-accepting chemotaxis sensory transducer with Pas/Pac sensor n=1 Tax=Maridesulfovibrio hydrothermalis AM13 = DSM 14728 TaxID=1121451 RepID=L0REJ5_9BACT|nr:methyl-accepting chemotaxis protein [Maridesulfovibrio hydrothermalis]CCO24632.1 Methyl-accepting chemotaxis sensory transducer with Pas/Pac sensor [Maridesulfovibrio hydrothermalis AM13 = DSM 14728]